jgi:hypothetical protein
MKKTRNPGFFRESGRKKFKRRAYLVVAATRPGES